MKQVRIDWAGGAGGGLIAQTVVAEENDILGSVSRGVGTMLPPAESLDGFACQVASGSAGWKSGFGKVGHACAVDCDCLGSISD